LDGDLKYIPEGTGSGSRADGEEQAPPTGDLSLTIVGNGPAVNSVDYAIMRNNDLVTSGSFPLLGDSPSELISGLESGDNYSVRLSSPEGGCTGISSPFVIGPDHVADVDILLLCEPVDVRGPDDAGGPDVVDSDVPVGINDTFNNCPRIIDATLPGVLTVGESTQLTVNARDADNDTLAYTWSLEGSSVGQVTSTVAWQLQGAGESTSGSVASFTCTSAGTRTLTVSVSDAPSRGAKACTRALQTPIVITCTPA
jgi:hypothetical protein